MLHGAVLGYMLEIVGLHYGSVELYGGVLGYMVVYWVIWW